MLMNSNYTTNYVAIHTISNAELRFIMNQGSSAPLLAGDSVQEEEEEERESYEVETITNHPKESNFNWQGEIDNSDVVSQYNPTCI